MMKQQFLFVITIGRANILYIRNVIVFRKRISKAIDFFSNVAPSKWRKKRKPNPRRR